MYFTKEFISSVKKKGYAILVEGYFDVLSLNQLGYSNSASPSGTALTIQQLEAISRYTNKILLCFDNDEAGLKATERVLEIKNQVSNKLEIHCLNLPEKYKDISELYEDDEDIFSGILKDNLEIIEFLIDKLQNLRNDRKNYNFEELDFKYWKKRIQNDTQLKFLKTIDLIWISNVKSNPSIINLEQIKKNKDLSHLSLIKQSRLSVMPIDSKSWKILNKMSK